MQTLDRLVEMLVAVLRVGILIMATAIFVIITVAVVMRYGFGRSFSWSEEVPRYLLIWISFVGAAIGVLRNEHLAFDLLYNRLPPAPRLVLYWLLNLLILFFGWIMLRYGIVFVQDFGSDTMETIPFTNYWYYPAMPITGGLIMLFAVQALLRSIHHRGLPPAPGSATGPAHVGVD